MTTLARPIGLGIAARGDLDDVVGWAKRARDAGLDSLWIHDSYFERDAVTYATAVAAGLAAERRPTDAPFRIALGAVNAFTRHPVVLAMTGSALDEVLPGQIVMGLGTGLPLRLKQMGIPYDPATAVDQVSAAIDDIRTLWAGERLPSKTPGLPPIQPMFAPPHRIPIAIAAYRKEFVALAGRKADAYLARPAESIPSLTGILERLRAAAVDAGRDPASVESAGYLLSLVDKTRREALNRAKREPFVIYMMSVLSDISLARAGFDKELRDQIAAAWRAEDFTTAGRVIPDELLDAFMLCGTREDVAAKVMAYHAQTGLQLPLLQPVIQEDDHIEELLAAATLYAELPTPAESKAPEPPVPAIAAVAAAASAAPAAEAGSLADDRRLTGGERVRRRLAATWEILRPFAYTASVIPVLAGAALAVVDGA
ncbi:MAG TPA: LLM class flavin-dependent oxidoreductase, partial [Candidatus Limnocylindrales bacterium]|nr:LLM class flavin-dependent oxidoreductase [Candidatus Limnocylindrales bacterium]